MADTGVMRKMKLYAEKFLGQIKKEKNTLVSPFSLLSHWPNVSGRTEQQTGEEGERGKMGQH